MSVILYVATLILNFVGIAFSIVYLISNIFLSLSDIYSRNRTTHRIVLTTIILSLIFAFISCFAGVTDNIDKALTATSQLYSIISISWLVMLIICGVSMLYILISRTRYKIETSMAIRKIFILGVICAAIAAVLAWLFA